MAAPQTRKAGEKGDEARRASCGASASRQRSLRRFWTTDRLSRRWADGRSRDRGWLRMKRITFYEDRGQVACWRDSDVDSSIPLPWHDGAGKPRDDGQVSSVSPTCPAPGRGAERTGGKEDSERGARRLEAGASACGHQKQHYIQLCCGPGLMALTDFMGYLCKVFPWVLQNTKKKEIKI